MSQAAVKEVYGLEVDEKCTVFPGPPSGAPLTVRDNVLRVRGGGHDVTVPELWAALAPDRGAHVVHVDTLRSNLARFTRLFSAAFEQRDTMVAWAVKSFPVRGVAQELAQ